MSLIFGMLALGCGGEESVEFYEPDTDAETDTEDRIEDDDGGVLPVDDRTEDDQELYCGDLKCVDGETCDDCPIDCGRCPVCDYAPSCTGADAVPVGSEPLDGFGNEGESIWSSGVDLGPTADETDCLDAQLRMRLRRVFVYENGADLIKINMYCIISASEGDKGSELYVTPLMTSVQDGDTPLLFDPSKSKFWGQMELRPTNANLSIDYRCYRSQDMAAYEQVLDGIAKAAKNAGGVAGPYGWAFGVGSVAVSIVSKAVGASGGDNLWLHLQQNISRDALLAMTNGVIWRVRQTGPGASLIEDFDWELELEAWGCADARPWHGAL